MSGLSCVSPVNDPVNDWQLCQLSQGVMIEPVAQSAARMQEPFCFQCAVDIIPFTSAIS